VPFFVEFFGGHHDGENKSITVGTNKMDWYRRLFDQQEKENKITI
jgi:hypothetical protein